MQKSITSWHFVSHYIKTDNIGCVPIRKTSLGQQRHAEEEENADSTY